MKAQTLNETKMLTWPTIEEQNAYWEQRDRELDRTESTCDWFCDLEHAFDGEDAEEWQRRSEEQGVE